MSDDVTKYGASNLASDEPLVAQVSRQEQTPAPAAEDPTGSEDDDSEAAASGDKA